MYLLKNAWINIKRSKGRNILIGIVILIIAITCTISLAIKNTASSLITSYKNSLDVLAQISFSRTNLKQGRDFTNQEDFDQMKEAVNNIPQITLEDIINYADSNYVNDYYYTISLNANSSNIQKVSTDFSFGGKGNNKKGNEKDFTITGYTDLVAMKDFLDGNYTLIEIDSNAWDLIFDGNYCFINNELASLNELTLGSKISIINPSNTSKIIDLTVVGLYEENNDEEVSMFSNSSNLIITNDDVISNITSDYTVDATFVLTSYDVKEDFEEELYSKGLSEYYSVTTNEEEANASISSISNVLNFVTIFLILVIIIGVIVLLVINQINIRERKYEIGVLRTMGMKKQTLSLQFIFETLIVAFFALSIGIVVGSLCAKPIGNMLLANEINNSTNKIDQISNNLGGMNRNNLDHINGIVNISAFDSIDAVVNFKVIFQLFIIGILLTLVSSTSSVLSIVRFSPLDILKERS